MSTNLSREQKEEALRIISLDIAEKLIQGVGKNELIKEYDGLVEGDEQFASDLVTHIASRLDAYRPIVQRIRSLKPDKPVREALLDARLASQYHKRMLAGLGFFLLGSLVTGYTYLFAEPGGQYLICWGAILFGGGMMLDGYANWKKYS